ncbi:uncharacterized protein B0T15DRAFT_492046 [Chaetomium strumarium]|uniref:Macro domain-containing protein n=1 Tax=Chaetomium strumarium TaxID=1170767 RepID=A0AAJ0GV08_9PEZI|nr:hypothetical protein B0T15DRAFT_492046 [Chaetomium strumarium]
MPVLASSDVPSLSLLYRLKKLWPASPGSSPPPTLLGPNTSTGLPTPSKSLNDRVALWRGDITRLQVDAIVNAANRSLLGGGGVDGAIHRAAGPDLYEECRTLGGCETGSAKITNGYELPCRKVIHAVGPIYDPFKPEQSERLLTGCYTRSLELAVENRCRSIAFSAISTGVYGYPSQDAAPAALSAIRKFLVGSQGDQIDQVVIVTFEMKDLEAYNQFIPLYFPPVPDHDGQKAEHENQIQEAEARLDAEAEAVARELPNAPTSDPFDAAHAGKKQKHKDD